MKSVLFAVLFSFLGASAFADGVSYLPYSSKTDLDAVKAGTITSSIRLGDRTLAPANYKVGALAALVNSSRTEDTRKYAEQIAANAYGHVEFTAIQVVQFSTLSAEDQAQVRKFYKDEDINNAKGIVTNMDFVFKN